MSAKAAPPQPVDPPPAPPQPTPPPPAATPEPAAAAAPSTTRRATAEDMAKKQREISVSEFFTKNRHLLGFDNPRKALLTTIKEGVDNSMDACEEAGILPDIIVRVEAIPNETDHFRVTIEDNGPGIVRKQIPLVFAKLLYGSKFHTLKMSRGQQGIGISAAAMYGQLTTGRPTLITSRTHPKKPAWFVELMLDTLKNQPRVLREEETEWDKPHGTRVVIDLEAKYLKGRQSVDEYLEQTAIANPHADLTYLVTGQEPIHFARAATHLPPQPRAIKPHPNGIELGVLIKMLQSTNARYVHSFLSQDFSRVSSRVANDICERAGLRDNAVPKSVAKSGAHALFKALQDTKLMSPPTDCVVPIGEELMQKGLERGVKADFYTTVTRPPAVYRGNPFVIEAGLAYGGDLPPDAPIRLLRFANRVPLLYQQSACATARAASTLNWRGYGLSQSQGQIPIGPMILMIHVASVWVPFTSESKEAVAHYPEMLKQIKLALQECGRRLGAFLSKRAHAERESKRLSVFQRYIGEVAQAVGHILESDPAPVRDQLLCIAQKATSLGAENIPVLTMGRLNGGAKPTLVKPQRKKAAAPAKPAEPRKKAAKPAEEEEDDSVA